MMMFSTILFVTSAVASDILVVDFKDTSKATTHKWTTNNDPVMGGQNNNKAHHVITNS